MCPVHTPDGTPCGLLNHLAASCQVVCENKSTFKNLSKLLSESGVISLEEYRSFVNDSEANYYRVMLDSHWFGWVSESKMAKVVETLRSAKISGHYDVSPYTEIAFVPRASKKTIRTVYPGLYIFTNPARFVRPVRNLAHNCKEFVGTMEQVYMGICVRGKEAEIGVKRQMQHLYERLQKCF